MSSHRDHADLNASDYDAPTAAEQSDYFGARDEMDGPSPADLGPEEKWTPRLIQSTPDVWSR